MKKLRKIRKKEELDLKGIIVDKKVAEVLNPCKVVLPARDELKEKLAELEKNNEKLLHNYYIIRILVLTDLYEAGFMEKANDFYNKVMKLETDSRELLNHKKDDLSLLYSRYLDVLKLQNDVASEVEKLLDMLYAKLKATTVRVVLDKDLASLKELYDNIFRELKDFPDIKLAGDYLIYNSGDFINRLVDDLLASLKKIKGCLKYDRKYFIGSDVAVYLDKKGWIDLYNKLLYVYKYIPQIGSGYGKSKALLARFEAKYAVIMFKEEKECRC